MNELKEKLVEALKRRGVDNLFNEHVTGTYGKEDAPSCENYLNTTANQIITLIKEANYVRLSQDQSLPEDYVWQQTTQSREAMRKYQSGEINKELHNIMQSRIHSEELAIYKKAQQDMVNKGWRKVDENKD